MGGYEDQDEAITDAAVHLVQEVVRSVDYGVVSPLEIWTRAKAALTTAAALGESYPHLVTKLCEKLQVDGLRNESAVAIRVLGTQLQENGWWDRFRALCERDALYIVAMAQAQREAQRVVDRARK